jgi:hypothetical protein
MDGGRRQEGVGLFIQSSGNGKDGSLRHRVPTA